MTATLETEERNEAERCRYCGADIEQGKDARWRAGGRAHCHFHPITGRSLDHKPMEE